VWEVRGWLRPRDLSRLKEKKRDSSLHQASYTSRKVEKEMGETRRGKSSASLTGEGGGGEERSRLSSRAGLGRGCSLAPLRNRALPSCGQGGQGGRWLSQAESWQSAVLRIAGRAGRARARPGTPADRLPLREKAGSGRAGDGDRRIGKAGRTPQTPQPRRAAGPGLADKGRAREASSRSRRSDRGHCVQTRV